MTTGNLTDYQELTELANKLFMYCDARQWPKLLNEVFTAEIMFDMESAGGEKPGILPAQQVCEMWRDGFIALDAVHHQAGHYLISIERNNASIFAYAVATHFRKKATHGHTRTFVGSYDLEAIKTTTGWRLNKFKYNLKFIDGNTTLE